MFFPFKPKDVFSFQAGNDGQMRDIARRHPRGERRHELGGHVRVGAQ
jgi:hypothetical protein